MTYAPDLGGHLCLRWAMTHAHFVGRILAGKNVTKEDRESHVLYVCTLFDPVTPVLICMSGSHVYNTSRELFSLQCCCRVQHECWNSPVELCAIGP